MGTHPIFESDFDCLTDINRFMRMSRRKTTNLEKLHNDSLISMEGKIFRSYYVFGDFVLLAFRKEVDGAPSIPPEYDYRLGRIDCVRLNKCPLQNQELLTKYLNSRERKLTIYES